MNDKEATVVETFMAVDFSHEPWRRLSLPLLQFRITAVTKAIKGAHVGVESLFLESESG